MEAIVRKHLKDAKGWNGYGTGSKEQKLLLQRVGRHCTRVCTADEIEASVLPEWFRAEHVDAAFAGTLKHPGGAVAAVAETSAVDWNDVSRLQKYRDGFRLWVRENNEVSSY